MKLTQKDIDRFWSYVDKSADCWVWTGATRNGYGVSSFRHITIYAHRFSWEIAHGEIDAGLSVLHHCDNRLCVNPNHLFLGTQKDNIRDMIEKGRASFVHPHYGNDNGAHAHPERMARGDRNGNSKLTPSEITQIRTIKNTSQSKIAKLFDVSQPLVGMIRRCEIWKHIK